MNYGKKNVKQESERLASRRTKHNKKYAVMALKATVALILCVMVIAVGAGAIYAYNLIKECPDISEVNITPSGYQTRILDKDGNEIDTLAASGANRSYVTLNQIPLDVQHAIVAIEDERFYDHNGIDIKGIIRAAFIGIASGGDFSQGASTITQQLLKNNYFTAWTSENTMKDRVDRKIQEQYLAVQLEKVTSKDVILENYLNSINLGQNTLGIEAASERYFNKSSSELTLSEAATIAGITQNPTKYNPISNPDKNSQRRKRVLKKMLELGFIDENEYETALSDDVYSRIKVVNDNAITNSSTSYFVDALTDEIYDDLIDSGHTENEAYKMLYSGGLTIVSTQDSTIQAIAEEEINNNENYNDKVLTSFSYRLTVNKPDGTTENFSELTMMNYYLASNPDYDINFSTEEECIEAINDYKSEIMHEGDTIAEGGETIHFTLQPQAATTIMDQSNGHVVALVGGRGDKNASRTLNRATDITRQPGSCFKIVACYAAALDAGGKTLASVQDDAPMTYANGRSLSNYDNVYRGFTNIREAIRMSMNVITVKNLTDIGTGLGFEYAQALGISTLESGDNNQSLCLGGITNGVTNMELTAAYAAIANKGDYNKPVLYTQVLDHQGNVLLDTTGNAPKDVLKESTAWLLTNAMQDVITSGTGSGAGIPGMEVAGKTGTTTKNRDTVFVAYTPYYTCGVWGGYDDDSEQTYTAYAKNIWKSIMLRVHENLESASFPGCSDIVRVAVCKKSGKLAIEGVCDSDPRGDMVYYEYFARGTEPTEECDHHVKLDICDETGEIATEYCPNVTSKVFIVGGSEEGTQESEYVASEEFLNKKCTTHASAPAPEPVPAPGSITITPSGNQPANSGSTANPSSGNPSGGTVAPNGSSNQQPNQSGGAQAPASAANSQAPAQAGDVQATPPAATVAPQ